MCNISYETNIKNIVVENNVYLSYGIDCFENENSFKRLVLQITDVSADFNEIQKFVGTLNKLQLSYTHLYDAVEDFINSNN